MKYRYTSLYRIYFCGNPVKLIEYTWDSMDDSNYYGLGRCDLWDLYSGVVLL